MLGYLYRDAAGRAAVVKRVTDHPGVARALSFLEKVMVLAPKNTAAYSAVYSIHRFTRNTAALTALEQRIRAANLDYADRLVMQKEFLAGAKDQQTKVSLAAALKRNRELVGTLRAKGGRTAAVAIDQLTSEMLGQAFLGEDVDPDKIVKLAEEADRLSPSVSTQSALMTARLFQAQAALRRADREFDTFCKTYGRSLGIIHLMALAASDGQPFQQRVRDQPEFKGMLAMLEGEVAAFPDDYTTYEWALLKALSPAEADKAALAIRKSPRMVVDQTIVNLLEPFDAGEALETYWLMQILGKPDDARGAIGKIAETGIPLPIRP